MAIIIDARLGRSRTGAGSRGSNSSRPCTTSCLRISSPLLRPPRHGETAWQHIEATLPDWSLAPVVHALQSLRGLRLVAAAVLVAELGDITRFDSPRQLMAYLGLVPSEASSGSKRRQGGITKAGNGAARRVLIEAAWTYRFPARISRELLVRQERLAKPIRDIAWKAQERLCRRYRRLIWARKVTSVATAAIARELVGFVWAIARQVQPNGS